MLYLYYKSLQKIGSAVFYAIINAFSVLLGALIAVNYFGESLNRNDKIGIILIAFGIIILGQKKASINYS